MSSLNRNQHSEGGSGMKSTAVSGGLSASGYFRSLEELAGTSKSLAKVDEEFPSYSPGEMLSGKGKTSRRSMMKYAGASMALAGITMTGCRRWPKEEIVAYSSNRQGHIPGVPEQYASSFELGGIADGVLVTSYDGRPIKVEGSPDHPMTVSVAEGRGRYGASTMFAQASVLEMYDPERSRAVRSGKLNGRSASSFEAFLEAAKGAVAGGGVGFLSTATSSQTFAALKGKFPGAKWYEYEALSDDNERAGAKLAFGSMVRPIYDFTKADVIVSIDSDFLGHHPAHLRYAADWATKRRTVDSSKAMSRVFVVESGFTSTGASADVRQAAKLSDIDAYVRLIAAQLGVSGASGTVNGASGMAFVEQVVADVKKAGANAVFIAGDHLAPETQAVVHAINSAIKSGAVKYVTLPDQDRLSHVESIKALAADLASGAVKALFVLSANPAYDAPADLMIGKAISDAPFSAYLGIYENETSHLCNWHVPEAHYLESWGEARGYDGTVSLVQPLIEPLFGGKTKVELLAALSGTEGTGRDWVKSTLKLGDEVAFQKAIQTGVIAGSGYPVANVTAAAIPAPPQTPAGSGLEVRFIASSLYDGRYANLGWLCELPDGMTRITWDNCIILSKKDADAAGVMTNDVVRLTIGSKTLDISVYVLPGQPIGVAAVQLGYARKAAGEIGNNNGFDTYSLRTTAGFYAAGGTIVKVPGEYELATTQEQYPIYSPQWKKTQWVAEYALDARLGKPHDSGMILKETTLERFKKGAQLKEDSHHVRTLSLQLWDPPKPFTDAMNDPTKHSWGMSIDMNSCTGCGACVVACQAENNIPTVGKHQVLMHRSMHWIRIDRYFKHDKAADPDVENPTATFMPMMCVHCENAPCEQVCPVAATVHDTEGLNTMVYNRCIGTRYCANNCPYKVRRFNYFDYHATSPRAGLRAPWPNIPDRQQREKVDPVKAMAYNPEVTVRMRGVMEKCSYCTQRVQTTKIAQRNAMQRGEGGSGKVEDGMVLTACQQACPTQAIWFGDMADRNSKVVAIQKSTRSYDVLAELNTRPRTKYLGKLRNPAVEPPVYEAHGHGGHEEGHDDAHGAAAGHGEEKATTKPAEHGTKEGGGH